MSTTPSVSIIIPAYNEEDVIAKCLDACVMQTSAPDEIIVVNNNSTDGTASIVRRYQRQYPELTIRLLNETEQGLIPARNYGLNSAKSDVLGRIDADTAIEPGWVAAVRKTFRRRSVAAATGPMLYHDMPLQKAGLVLDEKIRRTLHRLSKNHKFLFGSNMAIRKSAWQQIAPYIPEDPDDLYHEDINLALTLGEQHLRIVYDPLMIAGMSARRLEDSPRKFYSYVMRFERTFKAHNVRSTTARIPIFIYLLIYFPIRTVRKFYDGETSRFTLQKLRNELAELKAKLESSI